MLKVLNIMISLLNYIHNSLSWINTFTYLIMALDAMRPDVVCPFTLLTLGLDESKVRSMCTLRGRLIMVVSHRDLSNMLFS